MRNLNYSIDLIDMENEIDELIKKVIECSVNV